MKLSRKSEQARSWGPVRGRQRKALDRAGVEVGHVLVEGVRIRYAQSKGSGDPLLLCNGIGANLELTLPFIRALKGMNVVVFDIPGVGGSQPATFWPNFANFAKFAVGVLDALGYTGHFSVAGVSWGGGLAQCIAHRYASRVSHLILVSTTAGFPMVPGRLSALMRMITPYRYLSRNFMARNAEVLYGDEVAAHPNFSMQYASMTRAPRTGAYLQQLAAICQFSSWPWLHQVRCSALVISGDDDPLIHPINARVLAFLLPDASLRLVPKGGHLVMLLRAEETAGYVRKFLEDNGNDAPRARSARTFRSKV